MVQKNRIPKTQLEICRVTQLLLFPIITTASDQHTFSLQQRRQKVEKTTLRTSVSISNMLKEPRENKCISESFYTVSTEAQMCAKIRLLLKTNLNYFYSSVCWALVCVLELFWKNCIPNHFDILQKKVQGSGDSASGFGSFNFGVQIDTNSCTK